eukprot:scaffold202545_cov36-Tisochrysis_lutea.AAC.3
MSDAYSMCAGMLPSANESTETHGAPRVGCSVALANNSPPTADSPSPPLIAPFSSPSSHRLASLSPSAPPGSPPRWPSLMPLPHPVSSSRSPSLLDPGRTRSPSSLWASPSRNSPISARDTVPESEVPLFLLSPLSSKPPTVGSHARWGSQSASARERERQRLHTRATSASSTASSPANSRAATSSERDSILSP